jgi:hypothetical protein
LRGGKQGLSKGTGVGRGSKILFVFGQSFCRRAGLEKGFSTVTRGAFFGQQKTFQEETMSHYDAGSTQDMKDLLARYPTEAHDSIISASHAEAAFRAEYEAYVANGYDVTKLQKPVRACIVGTEPHAQLPKESATGMGKMLAHSRPGGFAVTTDGDELESVGVFYELAGAYGVPVLEVQKHNDSYVAAKIRIGLSSLAGRDEIRKIWGRANARMTAQRASLFVTVTNIMREKGIAYFADELHVPLIGTDDQNFDTCQAALQAVWDIKTLRDLKKKNPHLPEPYVVLKDLLPNGEAHAYSEKTGRFHTIPRPDAAKDQADYEAQLEAIFQYFDPVYHDTIILNGVEQMNYRDENAALAKAGGLKAEMHKRAFIARARCADSRQTPAKEAAEGIGAVLYFRKAGGMLSDGNRKLSQPVLEFLENIATYENVQAFEIQQHSGCGAMKAIYTYYAREDGPAYILDHYGEHFVSMAIEYENLYTTVRENLAQHGYAFYEKLGIKLHGEDDQKFQTCMAIEQGLRDYALVKEYRVDHPNTPLPLYFFQHLHEMGRMYVFDDKTGQFAPVPRADGCPPEPNPRGADLNARVCACGCQGHGKAKPTK